MWVLLGNPSRPPRSKGELPPLLLRLTNLLGYLFLILVNVLSSTGALGGTNAEVSAKFPSPLTPAGWAFAIWGVIFALEGLGVVYQIMNKGYREGGWKTSVVIKIGYGWQAGWLFQDLWQFAFVRENVAGMWLAAAALLAALASFQLTLHRLNGTTHELRARGYAGMPAAAYVMYKLPTAINAAWLSVAAALGILIVPVAYGVSQEKLVPAAAVLAVAVTAGGLWRLLGHRDAAYGLTLIWALSAVASNDSGNVPRAVKIVGIICLVVLALGVVSALVRTQREKSSAAAAAAAVPLGAGVDGSLLSDPYSPYGMYGDQRTLLSDPDAPAGFRRTSSSADGFTFPAPPNPAAAVTAAGGGGVIVVGGGGGGGAAGGFRPTSSEGLGGPPIGMNGARTPLPPAPAQLTSSVGAGSGGGALSLGLGFGHGTGTGKENGNVAGGVGATVDASVSGSGVGGGGGTGGGGAGAGAGGSGSGLSRRLSGQIPGGQPAAREAGAAVVADTGANKRVRFPDESAAGEL